MSSFVVKCPFCNKDVTIQSEYANQQLACPFCQNIFTAPPAPETQAQTVQTEPEQKPSIPTPPRQKLAIKQIAPSSAPRSTRSYTGNTYSDNPYRQSPLESFCNWFNAIKALIILGLVVCGAIWGIQSYNSNDKDKQQKKVSVEEYFAQTLIPDMFKDDKNIYSEKNDCKFVSASVQHAHSNVYKGTVKFTYKGKMRERTVICKTSHDYKNNYYLAYIRAEYPKKPSNLVEDAEFWYNEIQQDNDYKYLKDWSYVSATHLSTDSNTVRIQYRLRNFSTEEDGYIAVSFTTITLNDSESISYFVENNN